MKNNKKILIIGGTGDIGRAIARKFPKEDIVIAGSKEIDLNDHNSINSFFDENRMNKFEIFIFSSGINEPAHIQNMSHDNFIKTMQINCSSIHYIFTMNFKCMNHLKSFVAIGSLYSSIARGDRSSYVSSKHALKGLVKALAIDLAKKKCNANMVSPGFINTKLTIKNNSKLKLKKILSMVPVKKLGRPSDIANAVYFLTNKESKYINGIDLIVDGGFSTGGYQNILNE